MAKAILVLDEMPLHCAGCIFNYDIEDYQNRTFAYCGITLIGTADIFDKRYDWCPLKEMPKELPITADIDYITGYNTGWNDCIQHIEEN